jgi:uncharacterized protein YecE (DUF72 family)
MRVWIGTSGYSYPDWVGDFYPPGTKSGNMLLHYARHFPLVELNYTFYRPPTASALAALAEKAPPGFQFIVKIPQTISHEQRNDDLLSFRLAAGELARQGRLLALLCQLPQSCHHGRRNLNWLAMLGDALGGLRPAVEFRHRSWARPEMPRWLAARGLELVAVDAPDLEGIYPSGWVQAGRRAYVRLHSRNAANWYAGGKDRYDFFYSDQDLDEWVGAASSAAGETEEALFLFNNCHGGQAVVNARRLAELFRRRAPGLPLVGPFGEPAPVQGELFE